MSPQTTRTYRGAVTLTQLEVFVAVARHGSVRAAARELGVSEPAVSASLAALRQHLGDPLVTRAETGMALTEGGRRLVAIAAQMTHLAAQARAAVRDARGGRGWLQVAMTPTAAEHLAPPLVEAFTARAPDLEVTVTAAATAEMPAYLQERTVDLVLGPAPMPGPGVDTAPVLRDRAVVVAAPDHPAVGRGPLGPGDVARLAWVADAAAGDPGAETGSVLRRLRVDPARVRVFDSHAAALAGARDGAGLLVTLATVARGDLRRRSLVQVPVAGTPVEVVWHASTLGRDRRSRACSALWTFLRTSDAVAAMHLASAGVPAGRYRPAVHVTIWDATHRG